MQPSPRYAALLARLRAGGRVVIDGATGTEVERRGVPLLKNAWNAQAQVTKPDVLLSVHEDYYRSGAEIVISNTFACSRHALADAGEEERFEEYNRRAVEVACVARSSVDGEENRCVAGGIANWSFTDRQPSLEELASSSAAQAVIMRDAGADLIMLEMMSDLQPMLATLAGAREAGLPVWVGLSCGVTSSDALQEPALFSGDLLRDVLESLCDKDIDVVNIMHTVRCRPHHKPRNYACRVYLGTSKYVLAATERNSCTGGGSC
jgi:methionine synthase I (cobalamin-dependent)